jgi:N-carbamoyl-L-amino-acid hydrolase
MRVDQARLRADIEENATFGEVATETGRGRTVLTGTEADRQAREFFVGRLEDAGLDVDVDAVGNVVGEWIPESADPTAAPVAAGSHLDSVPRGGMFDGPLGTYGALEAVRTIQESGVDPERPLKVVSWTEEEGTRFPAGLVGSSVAAGRRAVDDARSLRDDEGISLGAALDDIGFSGTGVVDPATWDSWFEVHVEQGRTLEEAGAPVGVVDAIAGITTCRISVSGEANHAGTTPMGDRRDALVAASEFVVESERAVTAVARTRSETAVGTVGTLDVAPNATNVVPGTVEMTMDVRDVDREGIETVVSRARECASRVESSRPVTTAFERGPLTPPSEMAPRCLDAVRSAADGLGVDTVEMHSAALHDTATLADVTDTALLFAPSRDGISHNPSEWTEWDDCATATSVLAGAMADAAT